MEETKTVAAAKRSSKNEIVVIVNGQKHSIKKKKLDFDEIVRLAFEHVPTGENWVVTVGYHRGPKHNPEGTLSKGQSVEIQNGMIFDVTATDKS
ncbi:MAG: multiubiquitin domain-containing protein [Solirubrobacterales bacterium]|nr:multiubiquitin domain-containing protein [Solirubrobacterales bacterium]